MQNQKENIDISVVIPCLNEEETLGDVLQCVVRTLESTGLTFEIIVADNGSKDKSVEIANQYGVLVVKALQKGYGSALQKGIDASQGKYIIFGDADGSYDFAYIPVFIKSLQSGQDLVIGSRLRGKMEEGAMPFLHRYIGTPILTFLINFIYDIKVSDCNSGMRGFVSTIKKDIEVKSSGMEFISEMLIHASFFGTKIYEFPMNFYKDKRSKPPHLRTWRDGLRNLKVILAHIPKRLSYIVQKKS